MSNDTTRHDGDELLNGLKMAISVDDQFQWTGLSFPEGYGPKGITKEMLTAFSENDVPGVYAFNSTAPAKENPGWLDILDDWMAAGHYVGNHTDQHVSLNWIDSDTYIRDIDSSEKILSRWIEASPTRYFRYSFGMEGDQYDKTLDVQTHLTKTGFISSPVTLWFYDAQFMAAYHRAIANRDKAAMRKVEDLLVDTALEQTRRQVSAIRDVLGRIPPQIFLIHGTSVAGATIGRILNELRRRGVEFITTEEAMADPANVLGAPYTTHKFRNMTQKWAEFAGRPIENMPPKVLEEVEEIAWMEGQSFDEVLWRAMEEWAQRIPFTPNTNDFP